MDMVRHQVPVRQVQCRTRTYLVETKRHSTPGSVVFGNRACYTVVRYGGSSLCYCPVCLSLVSLILVVVSFLSCRLVNLAVSVAIRL